MMWSTIYTSYVPSTSRWPTQLRTSNLTTPSWLQVNTIQLTPSKSSRAPGPKPHVLLVQVQQLTLPDVHGTTTNTDHNSNNYQLTARPVIQHIQHTHQPAKAAPKTLCSEINSCCGCTTIAWIVFATIVMTCAMKYRFTGRIKVGSDIWYLFQGPKVGLADSDTIQQRWARCPEAGSTTNNRRLSSRRYSRPQQRLFLHRYVSDYDLVQTTCFVWRCCSHSGSIVEQRLVQKCTLEHTKRFTSNGFEICNGDNGNPLGGFLIQCVHPNYYPRIRESPPIHVESKSKIFLWWTEKMERNKE